MPLRPSFSCCDLSLLGASLWQLSLSKIDWQHSWLSASERWDILCAGQAWRAPAGMSKSLMKRLQEPLECHRPIVQWSSNLKQDRVEKIKLLWHLLFLLFAFLKRLLWICHTSLWPLSFELYGLLGFLHQSPSESIMSRDANMEYLQLTQQRLQYFCTEWSRYVLC